MSGESKKRKEYRACGRKETFYTSREAHKAAYRIQKKRGGKLQTVYHCGYCGRYHLTTKAQGYFV